MIRRTQLLVIISAVLLFLFTFFININSFSNQLEVNLKLEIIELFKIIGFASLVGLLFGLVLFKRQKYIQRIIITIPIAFILFALPYLWQKTKDFYGLEENYNYFTAVEDIKNGKVQIIVVGLILPDPTINWERKLKIEKLVQKKFGYESVNFGCAIFNGVHFYNSAMEKHLEKINGKNWKEREKAMLDSLLKTN